jgi:hypothetical protein
MLLRFLGIFAAARGLPAHVVLLPQAARVHRPQVGQTVLDRFNASLDFAKIHVLYHSRAIGFCQQKNAFSRKQYSGSAGLLPGFFPLFLLLRRRQAVPLSALPFAQIDPLQ